MTIESKPTRYCTRCIYPDWIPRISFDSNGVCNYCHQYDNMCQQYPIGQQGRKELERIVEQIKREGTGKPYDVVIGVSGGCDSSYMLHLAKELGLRPLAAHFDNTWNSRTAVENIEIMLDKLGIDLFTIVADNQEYADIFKSHLKASIPETDNGTDLALAATQYIAATKYGIRTIFQGHSFRTEGISPEGWAYMDAKYLKSVQAAYGTMPIRTTPSLWFHSWMKWILWNRIRIIRPLYYVDYDKEKVKAFLSSHYGWEWYGGHHMENRTAFFFNNYWLPRKFGLDLRWTEKSALVRSGQLSRKDALASLADPKPFDESILEEILHRLKLTSHEFDQLMAAPNRSFRDFPNYRSLFVRLRPFFWVLAKLNLVSWSFYTKYTRA